MHEESERRTRILRRSRNTPPATLVVVLGLSLTSTSTGWRFSCGLSSPRPRDKRGTVPICLCSQKNDDSIEALRAVPAWDASSADMHQAVENFEAREYTPPIWARNAHFHTIVASGDLEKRLLGDRMPLDYWRERWPTPDGDFVDIDWLKAEGEGGDGDIEGYSADDREHQVSVDDQEGDDHFGALNGHVERRGMGEAARRDSLSVDIGGGETNNDSELREAARLAEQMDGTSLGLGHPDAPEEIHKEHASWMIARGKETHDERTGTSRPRRLVLMLHGLESSSTAPLTKRFSNVYSRNGFDVAAINFRGCSGQMSNFPMGYHLGYTQDLLHVIEEIHRRFPNTWDRLYLSGFSLGGNVIVKFLGEQGDRARELGVYGAAVGCVPFEPQLGAEKLDRDPLGRYLYMPIFLTWLTMKAIAHARAFPDVLNEEDVLTVKTFSQFDSVVTLPVFGFASKKDYYDHVNAANYLSRVRVPLMIVNAKDDPFIDGNALPQQDRVGDAPVRLLYHDRGGHCGFMSGVLSTVWKYTKDYGSSRKWTPWGSSWVPWSSTKGAELNDDMFRSLHVDKAVSSEEGTHERSCIQEITGLGADDGTVHAVDAHLPSVTGGDAFHVSPRGDVPSEIRSSDTTCQHVVQDYVEKRQSEINVNSRPAVKEGRWLPTELMRFIEHLDGSLHVDGRSQRRGGAVTGRHTTISPGQR